MWGKCKTRCILRLHSSWQSTSWPLWSTYSNPWCIPSSRSTFWSSTTNLKKTCTVGSKSPLHRESLEAVLASCLARFSVSRWMPLFSWTSTFAWYTSALESLQPYQQAERIGSSTSFRRRVLSHILAKKWCQFSSMGYLTRKNCSSFTRWTAAQRIVTRTASNWFSPTFL